MERSLKAFLSPALPENKEVIISKRFTDGMDKEGNPIPVPFEIRALTQDENKLLIKKYTKKGKNGNETFDKDEYVAAMVCLAVVYPDLKNADLQKAHGVLGETSLIQKILLPGEYANLIDEVQKLSGFDEDINEEIEEAKN